MKLLGSLSIIIYIYKLVQNNEELINCCHSLFELRKLYIEIAIFLITFLPCSYDEQTENEENIREQKKD